MTPTALTIAALFGLTTYTAGRVAIDAGRFIVRRSVSLVRWHRSGPSDAEIRETAQRIRSMLEAEEGRPAITLDLVKDVEAEKRIAWGRAR